MENRHPAAAKRNLKRKLEREDQTCSKARHFASQQRHPNISVTIREHVSLLSCVPLPSPSAFDCALIKDSVTILSELAENERLVKTIVNCGAVPALVRHLQVPDAWKDEGDNVCYHFEVAKQCALVLELLATETEYQQHIIEAGALPCLVDLLRRHKISAICQPLIDLLRRVAGAITSLAHENNGIKALVRMEGGIPPLVELLEFNDIKVQRAAARALRTIAFNNDGNKNQIVQCNALPTLVLMLQSEDLKIRSEAVGVIGNLVHSSPSIKKEVLLAGALQPVICSLSSSCPDSQREAALLLGQFATADSDCKVHIAQRGAIPPLVSMLKSPDAELREMSSFALGRLAQDSHNQAGIAHNGGIEPLLKLLGSSNVPLQHNAAFALYGLADNEDIVVDIIKAGALQKLKTGLFKAQQTKECVAKTLIRLQEKTYGRVLKHLIHLMRFAEEAVQRLVAIALAYLCSPHDLKTIFIDNNGLTLLLDILKSSNVEQKAEASVALHKLADKASSSVSHFDAAPPPTPQMYLGEEFVNNPKLSDVTFLVEGKSFYAHRGCLLSSDIFRAMFDGGYRETKERHIVIPNIKWDVFESMMRIYFSLFLQRPSLPPLAVTAAAASDCCAVNRYLWSSTVDCCAGGRCLATFDSCLRWSPTSTAASGRLLRSLLLIAAFGHCLQPPLSVADFDCRFRWPLTPIGTAASGRRLRLSLSIAAFDSNCHFWSPTPTAASGCRFRLLPPITSSDQLADVFTKLLKGPRVDYICNKLGAYDIYAPA